MKPSPHNLTYIGRRRFIRSFGLTAILTSRIFPAIRAGSSRLNKNSDTESIFLSAAQFARGIRAKSFSSTELVEAFFARIAKVNPTLNAVCALDPERARTEAKKADALLASGSTPGPLHGVPITVKDSLDTEGLVTTGGTTGRAKFIPVRDATAVERLRKAGAIILGKTNTAELTLAYETDNLIYGRTNNPFDPQRSPGGSSGGSAAIVSVGGSPLDLATDTAGSIRVPSHYCGVAGLKPTSSRVSRAGNILPPGGPVARWTQPGPIARRIEDLALVLPIIAGPDPRDPDVANNPIQNPETVDLKKLRIAFLTSNGLFKPAPDIIKAVQTAAGALETHVLSVEEKSPGSFQSATQIISAINSADAGEYYRKLLAHYGTINLHPNTKVFLDGIASRPTSPAQYAEALDQWSDLQAKALEFARANADIILCPVCSSLAPKHSSKALIDYSYSSYFNVVGWPVVTLRVGKSSTGLPISIQITARPWKEHEALAVAAFLESALGGWQKDFPEK